MIYDAKEARALAEDATKNLKVADAAIEQIKEAVHKAARVGNFSCDFPISGFDKMVKALIAADLNARGFLWVIPHSEDGKEDILTIKW